MADELEGLDVIIYMNSHPDNRNCFRISQDIFNSGFLENDSTATIKPGFINYESDGKKYFINTSNISYIEYDVQDRRRSR